MNQEQPPGWYADPAGQRAVRWWDGQRWSADTRPTHGEGGPAFAGARQPSFPPAPQQPVNQGQAQQYQAQQYQAQQTQTVQAQAAQVQVAQAQAAQQTQTQQYRPRHHQHRQGNNQPAGPGRPPYAQAGPGRMGQPGPVPGQPGPYGSGAFAQPTQGLYSQPGGPQRQIPALLDGGPQHGARRRDRAPRGPWLARNITVVAGIGGAIVLIGLVAKFSTQESSQSADAGTTAVGAVVSPVASAVAVASPSPKATAHTVATFTGTGSQNTRDFTVTSDWKLSYSFSCASLGESGTFQVSEDGGKDLSGLTVNDLAESKSSSVSASNDAGKHYLAIASQCSWKLQVIDEP
jgi:hypothetical protein